jgi:hypothetical protein
MMLTTGTKFGIWTMNSNLGKDSLLKAQFYIPEYFGSAIEYNH